MRSDWMCAIAAVTVAFASTISHDADYCNSNPDQKPITAIDKFIRDSKKIEAKESDAFDPWEH
jgi:hypothetical protein